MKTISQKIKPEPIIHLLFWIISLNFFNAFFSRGVDSGFVLDGLNLDWEYIILFVNALILVLSFPFIWLFKWIKKWIKWTLTGLLILLLVWLILQMRDNKDGNIVGGIIVGFFLYNFLYVLIFHLTIIAAVYLNINMLIKRYLVKELWLKYFLLVCILAVVAGYTNFALYNFAIDVFFPEAFYISWFRIWELILIMLIYIAITSVIYMAGQYVRMLIERREKVQYELSALKEQINPHFLFNNLNTIYALAVKGDQRTKDVILQLSDFLRYVLYDTSSEWIELVKEVEIITTYVNLQNERINQDNTKVALIVNGNFEGVKIAPLLLLPIAENCFKHGVGKSPGSITIEIKYANGKFEFTTQNIIFPRENPISSEGGIGLKNLKKRLELIYPENYQLTIYEKDNIYLIDLKINISK